MDKEKISAFQKKILSFYKEQGRDLPWRKTTNRYHILVSEIMLQQTQVDRVISKYNAWLKAFKSPAALAEAPLSKVLKLWSGLGYNSRAKRLQDAAKIITKKYDGVIPDNPEKLLALPGIGPYTARSVLIFADNQDLATVDTNIRRILIKECDLQESISDKELFEIAQQVLPLGQSRDWHNALMDYGSQVLTSKKSGTKPKTQQSTFKGSRRQIRGAIIRHLTSCPSISLQQAKKLFPMQMTLEDKPQHDIKTIFDELLQEGLVEKNERSFRLP